MMDKDVGNKMVYTMGTAQSRLHDGNVLQGRDVDTRVKGMDQGNEEMV